MTSLFGSIQESFPLLAQYKYIILFVASSLEGFNTILVAGFLVAGGVLHPVPTFFLAVCGEIINSFIWYAIGYWGGASWIDRFTGKSPERRKLMERLRRNLVQYAGLILILVKMTWSITVATVVLTGSIRYPLRKFAFYNAVGSIGWVLLILSLGYFLGTGFQLYAESFRHISYLIVLIAVSLVLIFGLRRTSQGIFFRVLAFADTLKIAGEQLYQGLSGRLPEKKDDERTVD